MVAPEEVPRPMEERLATALTRAEDFFKESIQDAVVDVAATFKNHYPQADLDAVASGPKDGTSQEAFASYQDAARPVGEAAAKAYEFVFGREADD